MDTADAATWVRQFADEIRRIGPAEQRLAVLAAWRQAHDREATDLLRETCYRARRAGLTTEVIGRFLGYDRHTVALAAEAWAAAHGYPSTSRPGVPSIDAVRTMPGAGS